jgi:hypothetical protein
MSKMCYLLMVQGIKKLPLWKICKGQGKERVRRWWGYLSRGSQQKRKSVERWKWK